MNKTERMYAVVEELRAISPRPRSSTWLARRFEVSSRTIERDLLALQQAGVPIWANPGRHGGYSLDAAMTLPPLNFTPVEAAALVVALATSRPSPLAAASRTALAKILAAMTPASRQQAAELIGRIHVAERDGDPALLPSGEPCDTVVAALAAHRVLDLEYTDREDAPSRRTVEPMDLICVGQRWYLLAWCRLRDGPRVFRIDRISRATTRLETSAVRGRADWQGRVPGDLRTLSLTA